MSGVSLLLVSVKNLLTCKYLLIKPLIFDSNGDIMITFTSTTGHNAWLLTNFYSRLLYITIIRRQTGSGPLIFAITMSIICTIIYLRHIWGLVHGENYSRQRGSRECFSHANERGLTVLHVGINFRRFGENQFEGYGIFWPMIFYQ